MTPRYKRNALIIALVHVGVIAGIAMVSWIRDLIPDKPREITTMVELREPAPPSPEPLTPMPPEPDPEPEPPPPEPEPPPKPKPKLKKAEEIQVSKKRVQLNEPPSPKPPPRKRVRPEDLAEALRPHLPQPTTLQQDDFPAWYYALVRQAFYEMWQQPSSASVRPGAVTRMTIRVQRDGRITQSRMARSSGNAAMDASVMQAVQAIPTLKELPPQYRGDYKDITVDFELTGTN